MDDYALWLFITLIIICSVMVAALIGCAILDREPPNDDDDDDDDDRWESQTDRHRFSDAGDRSRRISLRLTWQKNVNMARSTKMKLDSCATIAAPYFVLS